MQGNPHVVQEGVNRIVVIRAVEIIADYDFLDGDFFEPPVEISIIGTLNIFGVTFGLWIVRAPDET